MSEAPDLHIVYLHAALGQFGHQPAQGEVGLCPIQQPIAQLANQKPWLVTTDLARSSTSRCPASL